MMPKTRKSYGGEYHDFMYYHKTNNALDIPKTFAQIVALTCLIIFVSISVGKIYSDYELRNNEYVKMTPELKKQYADEWLDMKMLEEESRP